jgi:hypothetical protein
MTENEVRAFLVQTSTSGKPADSDVNSELLALFPTARGHIAGLASSAFLAPQLEQTRNIAAS